MIPGCGTLLPTRSIPVRKPSRKPPFFLSSMPDAGRFAIRAVLPTDLLRAVHSDLVPASLACEHMSTAIALAS